MQELDTIMEKLDIVTKQLDILFTNPLDEQLSSNPIESAELLVLLSLSLNTLSFVYLKLNGIAPTAQVKNELKRCREYFEKINQSMKISQIDKDAAKRFIKHGLGKK